RAQSLVMDPRSPGRALPLYLHFPAWYQAEKQGFVDFNFAVFRPQIARFAQAPSPSAYYDSLSLHPTAFDWRLSHGARYRYFFVRRTKPIPAMLFAGAPCPPVQIAASGAWVLLENRPCAAKSTP
ncbi:MAG TPA: hypothetical protein VGI30_10265, partial [Caulobacteraceae bacterium]